MMLSQIDHIMHRPFQKEGFSSIETVADSIGHNAINFLFLLLHVDPAVQVDLFTLKRGGNRGGDSCGGGGGGCFH